MIIKWTASKNTILLITAFLTITGSSMAQTVLSNVNGRVVDPQMSAVTSAELILTNLETAFVRSTTSNEVGEYSFISVPPGKYSLVANKRPDFASETIELEISVATTVRVEDIKLNLSTLNASVEVIDREVKINTFDAQISLLVNTRQLADLPTRTRNPYDFITLSPGSVATLATIGRGTGFAVNGQSLRSGNFLLDGGENIDPSVGGVGQLVSLDAVQEYNLQTNNFQAEYGRNIGYIANVSSRTGGNLFHGNLFEYNLNSAFAANSFSNNARNRERPGFVRNQFGATLGGPVLKKKLFFFGSLEGRLVRSGYEDVTVYVPTSDLLSKVSPGTRAIFNTYPVSGVLSKDDFRQTTIRPFGGSNEITVQRAFVGMFRRVAHFSIDGTPNTRVSKDFAGSIGAPQDTLLASGRLDFNLNPDMRIFGRFSSEINNTAGQQSQAFEVYKGLSIPRRQGNQSILLNLNRVWSPKLVTEAYFVFSRISQREASHSYPGGFAPQFELGTRLGRISLPFGEFPFGMTAQDNIQTVLSTTYQSGSHTLKFGGQYSYIRDNRDFRFYQTIVASFNSMQDFVDGRGFIQVPVDPRDGQIAGKNSGSVAQPVFFRHYRYHDAALYLQDTWRVSRELVLSPGLRWDYYGPPSSIEGERYLDVNFYPGNGSNTRQQLAAGRFYRVDNAPGKYKGHFYLPTYSNIGPRIGGAYSFGKHSVLRSGFGVFFDRIFNNAISGTIENPLGLGFARLGQFGQNIVETPILADLNNLQSQNINSNVYNLFGQSTNYDLSLRGTAIDPNFKPAYMATWNVTYERDFKNIVIATSYIGSRSQRLFSANNVNRNDLFEENRRGDIGSGRLFMINSNGQSTYQAIQFRADSRYLENIGLLLSANYTIGRSTDTNSSFFDADSLLLLDEENDFFNFNTLSRFETNTFGRGLIDPYNPKLDLGPSDFDVTHRVATNFIWDLPVGRKIKNSVLKQLIDGWTISGIVTAQGGRPFSVIDTSSSDVAGAGVSVRPNVTGPLPLPTLRPSATQPNTYLFLPLSNPYNVGGVRASSTPFDRSPSLKGPFTNVLPRNTFRAPGLWTADIAVMHNFSLNKLREGVRLQLRVELYNVLNHANLFVNPLSLDILQPSFRAAKDEQRIPGVTASFGGIPRQIILAVKFVF